MPHGRSFRLKRTALAIDNTGSRRSTVYLSRNDIIHVSSWSMPSDSRMIIIRCKDRSLAMFASDLFDRGDEVTS